MSTPPQQGQSLEAPHNAAVLRVERIISDLLRIGVISSLLLIVLGTAISFVRHPAYMRDPNELKRLTNPGAAMPETLKEVVNGVGELRGQSIVMIGLLLLIATPVVRVGVSVFAFVFLGDRKFVLITLIVFVLLIVSFFLGKVEG